MTVFEYQKHLDRNMDTLLERLTHGVYRPWPLLRIVLQKKPDSPKMRTLLIPAVVDRLLQTAIARQLSRSFEEEFLECSFGYRPGRSVDRAIARIRKLHELGYEYVVDADIHSFFDEVSHDMLLDRLTRYAPQESVAALLNVWVRAEVWTGERIDRLKKGVPQGSPISPLLANFFLEEFDRALESKGLKLVRYADDFLILSRTPQEAEAQLRMTGEMLTELHLRLAVEKTHLTSFSEGFKFLGAFFRDDSIWIPWKSAQRKGKLLYVAKPLPAQFRGPYVAPVPPGKKQMEMAFQKIHRDGRRAASQFSRAVHQIAAEEDKQEMPFLYLTDQGSILRKAGDRFLVEREDEVILDLPYHKLDTVVVFGNVQVTTQALGELLEKGIPLHFLTRQGEYKGSLLPPRGAQVALRLKQYGAYQGDTLPWAREFIAAKLANAEAVLTGLRAHGEPGGGGFDEVRAQVAAGAGHVAETGSADQLMGVEGAASKAYFEAFWMFNKSELPWNGRKMHPSTDALNALLSLAYTLLTGELTGLIESTGLDPYLGFLHQIDYNRPSLALDLIEPFRYPIVDRMVLRMVNRKQFQADDFVIAESNGQVHLRPGSLKRFLAEYEQTLLGGISGRDERPTWREVLREEVHGLARSLREGEAFRAFRYGAEDLEF